MTFIKGNFCVSFLHEDLTLCAKRFPSQSIVLNYKIPCSNERRERKRLSKERLKNPFVTNLGKYSRNTLTGKSPHSDHLILFLEISFLSVQVYESKTVVDF